MNVHRGPLPFVQFILGCSWILTHAHTLRLFSKLLLFSARAPCRYVERAAGTEHDNRGCTDTVVIPIPIKIQNPRDWRVAFRASVSVHCCESFTTCASQREWIRKERARADVQMSDSMCTCHFGSCCAALFENGGFVSQPSTCCKSGWGSDVGII